MFSKVASIVAPVANPFVNQNHCTSDALFAAEVSLSCLYRDVAQHELNVIEFSSSLVAQPCTGHRMSSSQRQALPCLPPILS